MWSGEQRPNTAAYTERRTQQNQYRPIKKHATDESNLSNTFLFSKYNVNISLLDWTEFENDSSSELREFNV